MLTLIIGGGDLASGVALRLFRAGLRPIITELAQPLAVRRRVCFAEAVYAGSIQVEDVFASRVHNLDDGLALRDQRIIPVLVDPEMSAWKVLSQRINTLQPLVVIDGRMTKRHQDFDLSAATLILGLGPGFVPGENCHAAIETNRGPNMGRVLWREPPEADSGLPEAVNSYRSERVLYAPVTGILHAYTEICSRVQIGQTVAQVGDHSITAPFQGVVRGLLQNGLLVAQGTKIGDIDPRDDVAACTRVSDKALAVGGGVLEAILTCSDLRPYLWS
jgi:xanthine dehydrogenase accessory factor